MSGTKTSDINYDRRGELILNIRSTKEDLLRHIRFLKQQNKELLKRIEKEKPSIKNRNLINILDSYADTLNARDEELSEKEKTIEDYSVRTSATIKELEKDQRTLSKEYDYINMVTGELQGINYRISEIVEIDNIIPEIEADIAEAESLMKTNGSLLQEWTPKGYEELVKESDVFKKRFDKYVGDINSGKTDSPDLASIKEIYKGIRNYINKIEALVTDYTVKDKEIKALKNRIEKLKKDINEQTIFTKDSVIKNILSDYLSRLKDDEGLIEKKNTMGVDNRLNTISHNLPLLKETDKINSDIESEINKVESIFKEHDGIFRKWVIKDYEGYLNVKGSIATRVSEFKKGLGNNIDTAKFESLLTQSKSLSDKVATSLSLAMEKDKLHQKRLYVIKSLREVCASLGFHEMDEPHYAEKDNPYSLVVQTFDTLNLGTITFTVALEGKLESSSRISIDHCDEEFSKFSELLKEQFGIETSLKRIEEGEPIKKYKTAKDLPTSAGKMTQKNKGG